MMWPWWQVFILGGIVLALSSALSIGVEKFFRSNHPFQVLVAAFVFGGSVGLAVQWSVAKLSPSLAQTVITSSDVVKWFKWGSIPMSIVIMFPLLSNISVLAKTKRLYQRTSYARRINLLKFALCSRNVAFFAVLLIPMIVVFGFICPLRHVTVPFVVLVPGVLLLLNMIVRYSIPPSVLLLGSSAWGSVRLFSLINRGLYPYRTVVLFDPIQAGIDRASGIERMNFRPDNLRIVVNHNWRDVVHQIAENVPIIVVDTRTPSPAVIEEVQKMVQKPLSDKSLFIINDDGTSPAAAKGGCLTALSRCRTTFVKDIVGTLKEMGLTETSSPDDNPVITQAAYDYHSGKLSRLMTAAGAAGNPLLQAVRGAEHKLGRTRMLEAACSTLDHLNGKPGDGALEVFEQLPGDIEAIEAFLEEWHGTGNRDEQQVVDAMRTVYHRLCVLQQAVDHAPVSFHLQNQKVLREQVLQRR